MGTRNRERRQAKQKAREQRRRERETRGFDAGLAGGSLPGGARAFQLDAAMALVDRVGYEAARAIDAKDEETVRRCVGALVDAAGTPGRRPLLDAALVRTVQEEIVAAWERGWQPADLARMAQRSHGSLPAMVVVDFVTMAMRPFAPATVDERWEAQLRELGADAWWASDDEYPAELAERKRLTPAQVVRCLFEVLHSIVICPPIQMLCPPPGKARRGSLASNVEHSIDARQLDRVRALLAKAESTTYPEEAEAYTAKAQELMARYSIDYALLVAEGGGTGAEPTGRRIGVDNPYEGQKVLLVGAVAKANRCRTVWAKSLGFVTVLGFESDVDGVELLFTSLLVQATSAMLAAGSRRDAHGRSSTRSFRQSFLAAYAQRIGERLAESAQQATHAAARELIGPAADRLLPVLASRKAAVDNLAEEIFPSLVELNVAPARNWDGWVSGRAAADQARLREHRPVSAESAAGD